MTDSRQGHPIAPNRFRRSFTVPRPNQRWLVEPTYARPGVGRHSRGLRGPAGTMVSFTSRRGSTGLTARSSAERRATR
ncbi:hypothetical protein P2H44_14705 [Albimonas sp. CAU 1670]|uniref:hypothetical protein n=1 Tax=Albimonas sp. CAU 1670 TaxID=3032599 RepID=UPI0023D9C30D|nr:hypothetical protein [Albimonas sp. CAU 1670]MDF2233808.1 hypothetical protein [Albimonas sp. CAU 1670]